MSCQSDKVSVCQTVGELRLFLRDIPDDIPIMGDFEGESYEFAVWVPCPGDPSHDPFLGIEVVEEVEFEEKDQ